MIRNIFCDFANKEIRRVYGLYRNVGATEHTNLLASWINIAALLAPEWCLIPIGFAAESRTLQVVIERKEALLAARVLRLAMRDSEIEQFVLRRRADYLPFRNDYPPLFDDRTIEFLLKYAPAVQARIGHTALQIGERWPAGVQAASELGTVRAEFNPDQLGFLEGLPRRLADRGWGFIWNAVDQDLPVDTRSETRQAIRRFLHADFVRGYIHEFDLGVLTSLPAGWRDLGVQPIGGYLDYGWLDSALSPLDLMRLLTSLDGPSLVSLRNEAGFMSFQADYRAACNVAKTSYELRGAFFKGAPRLLRACRQLLSLKGSADEEVSLNRESIEQLGFVLANASSDAAEILGAQKGISGGVSAGTTRLYVEELDEFSKVKKVSPRDVAKYLNAGRIELSEDTVQLGIEDILAEPFHKKDWGGEGNDLYTTNLNVGGRRHSAAFLLKGNGLKARQMQIAHCGKNGDQILRLIEAPADLFVIQYVGSIAEAVIKDMDLKIQALRLTRPTARFCIVDGQDTARLLHAYGKIS